MSKMILYHGSSEIVKKPEYGKGKPYNDYGIGFYCTKNLDLAREWACTEGVSGFVNEYEIDSSQLSILDLSSEDYTILYWLALLMENRSVRLSTPIMKSGAQWLRDNYLPDIAGYDAIVGYRADDSYFAFARAFVNNEISLEQLSYAMKLGKLGEQFVLKSKRAFELIEFKSHESVDNTVYYTKRKQRDQATRDAFNSELDKEGIDGIYIRDLIRGEVMQDDQRL